MPILMVVAMITGKIIKQNREIYRLKDLLEENQLMHDIKVRELNSEMNLLKDEISWSKGSSTCKHTLTAPVASPTIPAGTLVYRPSTGTVLPKFIDPIVMLSPSDPAPTTKPVDTSVVDWLDKKGEKNG